MASPFALLPDSGSLLLARARVPMTLLRGAEALSPEVENLTRVDLEVTAGKISAITPSRDVAPAGSVDLDGGQIWPAFVDLHTHLDKGHILPRAANPDGSVYGAVRTVGADRTAHWSAADVRRRFEFGLRCAYAHGTAAIRTHLDCEPPQAPITFPVFAELRQQWAGRIDLQAVGKFPLELYLTTAGEAFAQLAADHGAILGAVTRIPGKSPKEAAPFVDAALRALFSLATRHGLDVDLHVDESGEPEADTLRQVAEIILATGFAGKVVCGHCCSLAVQPADAARRTMDLCAQAGLAVVTLPMINQYLQDRSARRTPRWRGVTLVHELRARGIPVAVASDNCRDPFFAYGDHDMLEVFAQSVRIAHLDLPYDPWPEAATATPAALMRRPERGVIAVGGTADLILFRARSMSELLSRPQSDRAVLRAGRSIDRTLPDHRDLDSLFQ